MFPACDRFRMTSTRMVVAVAACLLAGCSAKTPDELLADARSSIERSDYPAASIQLKNALQENPDFAQARLELGRVSLAQRDLLAAEKELNKALELGAPKVEAVPMLARVLVELGRPKDVASRFSGTRLETPAAQAKLDGALGYASLAANDREGALRFFDAALSADPGDVDALVGKARLLALGKDYDAASRLIRPLLDADSKNIEAWLLEAELLSSKGDKSGSIEALRSIYRIRPDHLRSRSAVISALISEQKYDEARSEVAELRKVAPSALEADYMLALLLTSEGKYVEARPSVQKVLAKAPDYLPVVWLAALVNYQLKSYAQAEQHAEKLITRGAGSVAARKLLIGTYLETGRVSKAQQALDPLLQDNPNDPELLALAARVQLAAGDGAKAIRSLAQSAQAQPHNVDAQSRLGMARLATGDYAGAIDALKSAARMDDGGRSDLTLILAYLRKNKADDALAALNVLEKKRPDDPLVYNLRGAAYLLKRQINEARNAFETALKIQPTYFPSASSLASLDLAEGKRDVAEQRFRKILSSDAKHPDALLALAGLKAQSQDGRAEAEKLLLRAVKEHPDLFKARVALVQFYGLAGDHVKAQQAARAAVTATPNDTAALGLLADSQSRAGDAADAVMTRQMIVDIIPNDPSALKQLALAQGSVGKLTEAEQSLKKALQIKPGALDVEVMLAGLYLGKKAFDETLDIARAIQKRQPDSPAGYLIEGDVMVALSRQQDAAAAFKKAYARDESAVVLIKLLSALDLDGQEQAARKLAEQWMKKQPKEISIAMYEAGVAMGRGKDDLARSGYMRVLERSPDNVVALNNMAWLLWKAKDKNALTFAERAYGLAADNPAVLDTYGMILADSGKGKEGAKLLEKAVEKAPRSTAILLNYAKVLVRIDRKAEARPHLEKLAALRGKFDEANEAAELLKSL